MITSPQQFLRKHPLFTYHEFVTALSKDKLRSPLTSKALLMHHVRQGHIVRVRRGLFATIPTGADANTYPINPYLIAGYATNDAVIAYHTALNFHNIAYSANYRFTYLTQHQTTDFSFRGDHYTGILFPPNLLRHNQSNSFTTIEDVQGLSIRVTSLERTLVDVLDKPLLGGGWEEIWRSLSLIEHLKINHVIDYAGLLNKPTTIAKVGFYLSTHQATLNVPADALAKLHKRCPASPYYIDAAAKKNGQFIKEWNLVVPKNLLTSDWEE